MTNKPTLDLNIRKTEKEAIFDELLDTVNLIREDYPFVNTESFVDIVLHLKVMGDFVGQLPIEDLEESYDCVLDLLKKLEIKYSAILSIKTKTIFRYRNYIPETFEEFKKLTLEKYNLLKREEEEKVVLKELSSEETITEELIAKTEEMRQSIYEAFGLAGGTFLDLLNYFRGKNNNK